MNGFGKHFNGCARAAAIFVATLAFGLSSAFGQATTTVRLADQPGAEVDYGAV